MKIKVLGSGTSHGVPVIGCGCRVCRSEDPRDARTRASILVEWGQARLLVDAGPEFRLQALRAGIDRLDAVLITHAHADHIHGMDDLRPLCTGTALPVLGNGTAIGEFVARFDYVFRPTQKGGGKPQFAPRVVEGPFEAGGRPVVPVPVKHGGLDILGYRMGDFAYLTDTSAIPEASFPLLAGVRHLMIDGLRFKPHPTHFSIDQAVDAARRIGASRTWITHICHDATHAELEEYLRAKSRPGAEVAAAWDGLEIEA